MAIHHRGICYGRDCEYSILCAAKLATHNPVAKRFRARSGKCHESHPFPVRANDGRQAVIRLKEDVGLDDWTGSAQQTFFHGFWLALKDTKTWLLMICATGIVSSGGVTNFFPSVVATLGFNSLDTLLLTAPPYLLAVCTVSLNAWHADRTGERYWHITGPLLVSILSFILAAATKTTGPRYFAMMIMPGSFYGR